VVTAGKLSPHSDKSGRQTVVSAIHRTPLNRHVQVEISAAWRSAKPSDSSRRLPAMGLNNRQRRAAKARQRKTARKQHHLRTEQSWEASDRFRVGAASLALRQLLRARVAGRRTMLDTELFGRHPEEYRQRAIDDQLGFAVCQLFDNGWTPADLHEVSRRKFDPPIVEHLMSVLADETARQGGARIDSEWSAQVAQLAATRTGSSREWARAGNLAWHVAQRTLIELLVLLYSLPVVEPVLAAPGAAPTIGAAATGVDERVLRRVRALLVKAESTTFQDEADALTAKAQQLMTQHSITRTLAEAKQPQRRPPVVRRMWLDAPYANAKSLLVAAVASSNHCYSVMSSEWGFVTLVGHDADLDTIELLTTSLLVQATRAMTASGAHLTRVGVSRTRSFRQSFLIAYAGRIGERLRESAAYTETAADTDRGGALLPVLAARDHALRDAVAAMFPDVLHRQVTASNLAGWGAGRAAADLALFDIHTALTGREHTG
jgi:hypothetical protein